MNSTKYILLRKKYQAQVCDPEKLGLSPIDAKLLHYLTDQPQFETDLKQAAIAYDLGTNRETICRRIKKLTQKGLITAKSERPTGYKTIKLNLEAENG